MTLPFLVGKVCIRDIQVHSFDMRSLVDTSDGVVSVLDYEINYFGETYEFKSL